MIDPREFSVGEFSSGEYSAGEFYDGEFSAGQFYEGEFFSCISTENINTVSLRYGLHNSFIDKSKYVKRNVSVELKILVRVFDAQVTYTEKKPSMNIYVQQQILLLLMYKMTWKTLTNDLVTK